MEQMPHWPWAKLGMARACFGLTNGHAGGSADDNEENKDWITYLCSAIESEIDRRSEDPVDRLLLRATYFLGGDIATAEAVKRAPPITWRAFPDLRELDAWLEGQLAR
jgi:hypothetical protein